MIVSGDGLTRGELERIMRDLERRGRWVPPGDCKVMGGTLLEDEDRRYRAQAALDPRGEAHPVAVSHVAQALVMACQCDVM